MNYTRTTAPRLSPVDLALVKSQCRIADDATDQDDVLSVYIDAATEWVEAYTGRSLLTQTWQISLEGFPERLWLPRAAPLASITHVKYYDAANVLTTLSSSVYTVPALHEPACVRLVDGQTWPLVWDRDDAVRVEYVTGASAPADVPASLRQAIQLLVAHWYANREAVMVGTISGPIAFAVEALCAPYRVFVRRPEWLT